MRCAALFGGRPERGTAGLANDVRSSHVLTGDSCDAAGGRSLGPCFFFWQSRQRQKSEETTASLARRLALIVSLQIWQE